MRAKKDSFSIVILGSWNPSIFTQDWVLQHLCESGTDNVTIAFPLNDPTAPRKIGFDSINLFPGRKQLLIQPDVSTLDGMNICAGVASKILGLLVHTPLTMCGINFSFEEEDDLEKLLDVLSFSDEKHIDGDQYSVQRAEVSRSFQLVDGNILNLALSDNGGTGQIGFNFHYSLTDITQAQEMFNGDCVSGCFNKAIQFCLATYDLNLEED